MSDRLEEIIDHLNSHDDAFYFKHGKIIKRPLAWDDIQQAIFEIDELKTELEKLQDENRRLISELEQSRAAMAEVRRLWEITIDRADKAEAEVKRLKAMLAIGHFVIRE